MTATTASTAATTHAGEPYRPDRRVRIGLAWRAALVVLAAVAVALAAPAWLRTPLSVAAAVATATFFAQRYRRRGALDAWLTAAGGGVVALALLGLLLNALPFGLATAAWAVGVAVLQLVLLAGLALVRPPAAVRRARPAARRRVAAIGWGAAVAGVLTAAVALSAASFTATHVAPLAIEATPGDDAFTVSVTSGTEEGPFRLELVTDDGRIVLARDVRVGPDAPAAVRVQVADGVRALVQLVPADGSGPVRELIVDAALQAGAS